MKKNSELVHKQNEATDLEIISMQKEIAVLEAELLGIKNALGAFESKIHARLDKEIAQVRKLYTLYKSQKNDKKAKRLEQKKRGKNYVAPKQEVRYQSAPEKGSALNLEEQKALKRLYKEAVVQVHPDKFVHSGEHDRIQMANAITAQLNGIYQRGDLEELINFYQYVMSGNALQEKSYGTEAMPDVKLRMESLIKKKEALLKQLEQLKSSYTYNVLITYDNPLSFIDELHLQLQEKIKQLEKRTRKARGI
ncbi:heat shock protein DnaJ domain-containing protein [Flammeovirgaceae bacterium 311]|nr:heat shock protein DnaJ domain-containing protein [Flammeovirgaceae bacterium 311]